MIPRIPPRAAVGVAVLLLGLLDVNALSLSVRSHTRLRESTLHATRTAISDALPRLRELIASGEPEGFETAAREAVGRGLGSHAAFFLGEGRLASFPTPVPLAHWPSVEEMELIRSGHLIALGPLVGEDYRVVTYAALSAGTKTVLLRVSTEVPDLVSDLRERRQLFVGHALALLLLVLAGALLTAPSRGDAPSSPQALRAYEEAMERLRDRGQEISQQHEAERRQWDDAIRDKEAMARAGELTAGMAHEMRNGLGTITGYARLIEREPASQSVQDAARGIRDECETLTTIVRRFVDFVKREDLHLAAFDLRKMLARVVARESRSRPGGEVSLAPDGTVTIEGDEELLERAFENLVRNAREAGSTVRVDVARDADKVTVTVVDDGPGLPRDLPLRPFFTTKPGGLGLGLPLAQKIVHLHDGELRLSPGEKRGLVVAVTLPSALLPDSRFPADSDATKSNGVNLSASDHDLA